MLGMNEIILRFCFTESHVVLCQTDAASVLSEAIEYIKFLHQQVSVSYRIYSR